MNEIQQAQGWYNCNGGCLRPPFSFYGVKRYCLDNGRVKLECVLCSACSSYQFSKRQELGFFPLLTPYLRKQEIKEDRKLLTDKEYRKQQQERKEQEEEQKRRSK